MSRILLICMSVLFLVSCNTVKTSNDYVAPESREFSQSKDLVFDEAVSTLMGMRWHITGSEKDSGIIQARTPMSMLTMGDVVNVHVRSGSKGKTRVDVTSASNQQYDWGKNQKNIESFYQKLRGALK